MRRILVVVVMSLLMTASSVFAQDDQSTSSLAPAVAAAATTLAQRTDLGPRINLNAQFKAPARPSLLPALYAGSAILQGYDTYSTLSALKSGAREANPLMNAVTKSPIAFVALKASVTTGSIMVAERMWKDNRRVTAVMMMVISNGMMAAVAAHNAAVLQKVK